MRRLVGALVTSLNQLFERVQRLVEQEPRFAADAAHELRTPLAGIRAQAQVALGATGEAERTRALDSAITGCDRATHAVEQMLTLARLAPDAVSFQPGPVGLTDVVKATISDLVPAALAKGIDLELTPAPQVLVCGDAGLLAILFRNLIDNAIRYSPPATRVAIEIQAGDGEGLVRIADAGPGISVDERANIGRRFYRAPGTQAPGSGLGLSIVRRILELHRGTMQFDAPPTGSGLQVTVALPAGAARARLTRDRRVPCCSRNAVSKAHEVPRRPPPGASEALNRRESGLPAVISSL